MRIAPPPAALIPKGLASEGLASEGLASEGLLAFIATAKFCDALPLYRQERQFARLGVELSRRTMSDWMIAAATACQALMYDGYARPCAQPGIVHVGCWAHVRRAFKEAADALGKVSSRAAAALHALGFIAKLYRAESELSKYRDKDPERFVAARRARVEPVLAKFHGWLQEKRDQVLPGSALGKAVAFALSEWPKLIRYLDHPQMSPDNNACEQAIRPFVVGRKNWLFSGSPRGAKASAILYSLIETAKANRREPYWYLRELFERLPHARTRADYLSLLPTARPPPPAS